MESCHSLPPRIKLPALAGSSANRGLASYSTTLHLVKIIEQLKSKDKIISHLERELGQRSGYALQVALESTSAHDAPGTPPTVAVTQKMDLSLIGSSSGNKDKLGDGSGTKRDAYMLLYEGEGKKAIESIAQLETEVQELRDKCDCLIQDNLELSKKLKDVDQRNRQLNEKNKKFLEKNVELTSLNRNLKDQTQMLIEDQKKSREQTEHSKRQCQQLSRQLQQELRERNIFAQRVEHLEEMKQQLADQNKTIASLRQSCSDKDRRIELMQHRKKRRKIRRSQERCTGVKETFYGYDEDSKSENSENSLSSVSFGTLSDEELWDELAREEVEKNYQNLMKEYMSLQRSHSLLLAQIGGIEDPQREAKTRCQLETDLLMSQGRIEELEKLLRDTGQGEACEWKKEKEQLFTSNEALNIQLHEYERENMQLDQDLREKGELLEDLEFRILELEECQTKECECGRGEVTLADTMSSSVVPLEMEAIQRSIRVLLADKKHEAQELVQKLDKFKDTEQQIINLECTAKELQAKVISLQKEKTTLEEMLLSSQHGGIAQSANRNESAEVLALKDQLSFHEKSEVELMEKNIKLQGKLDDCEKQNDDLVRRVQELEEKMMKYQAKHGKLMNRTDSEKEKLQVKLNTSSEVPSKKDVKLQTYTKMLDKSVTVKYEDEKHSHREFELLDQRVQILYEENLSLKQKLEQQKVLEEELEKNLDVPRDSRLLELEEYCEDIQDRLQTAEMAERQLREKLKLAEHTINDLEGSESYFREKAEELGNREAEAKKQTAKLCQTIHELKEIVLDKDVLETGLREKVDFLEKAELASAQIIQELQNNEKSLRRQLELKAEVEGDAKSADKLKKRITVLEKENKKLSQRVSELEEDEEVLRENWKRVADEDANRIDCLEQKVKMLDALNTQLRSSLVDVDDDMYIHNNGSSSLASELNESEKKNGDLTMAKRSFSTPYLHSVGYEVSMPPRSLSQRDLDLISEAEGLEKIQQLEEQISNIVEDKNSKIETLHEKIANLRENELKLTETLMEMEHEERELKAKLALYESSQVTVEKMLQYENKIFELHSSQENLLDRLESLEDHDVTLQEKLDMAEQQSKIKVGTIEKQMKNVQTQLEQAKLRGEELTKEKELLKKQIDKLENKIRLYVRKGEEAKEKINELNGQVSVFEQREQYASEKVHEMEQSLSAIQDREDKSHSRIAALEAELKNLRQEEAEARMKLESLREELRKHEERNSNSAARIQELEKHERELSEKISEYVNIHNSSKKKINELENEISDYDSRIVVMERDLSEAKENERSRLVTMENMERTQTELSESLKRLRVGEEGYVQHISKLEVSKSEILSQLEREKSELSEKVKQLDLNVREHVGSVKYLEQKLSESQGCEREHVEKITSLERTLSEFEDIVVERTKEVEQLENEKADLVTRVKMLNVESDHLENSNRELKDHLWNLQQDKTALEKAVLEQEGKGGEHKQALDLMKSSLIRLQESNTQYEEKVQKLSYDLKDHESKNSDLKVELEQLKSVKDGLEKNLKSLREEVYTLESENQDLQTRISEISCEKEEIHSSVESMKCDVDFLNGIIGDLKFSVKTLENEKSELKVQYDNIQSDCFDLRQNLVSSKSFDEETGKRLQQVSQELESVETSKKELLKSVLSLESDKQEVCSELEKYKSECEAMQVKWNESCENEKNLRDKLSLSKEKLEDLREKLNKSEEEKALLKSSQEALKQEDEIRSQENEQTLVKEKGKLEMQLRELQTAHDRTSQKVEVLQDAEGKMMDRMMQLEQVEASLREQLDKSQKMQQVRRESLDTEATLLTDATVKSEMSDQSTSTDDLTSVSPPDSGRRVGGIFQRVQELEAQNRDMSLKLLDHDSATSNLKQFKEKVKLLEKSEDKLMERVMELEENEESLKNQLGKLRRMSVDETDGKSGSMSFDSDTSALSLKLKQLSKDKELIQEVLKEEQEKLDKVSNEKLILEEELQHLNVSIQEEKQKVEEKVKSLERINQKEQFKVDSLKSSEIVLKKSLEAAKDAKKKLEAENTELQSQMIDLQTQIVDLENELQEERHKVEIVNDGKAKLEEKLKKLERGKEREKEREKVKAETYSSVESRLLKSMSGEKKALKEMESELKKTQEKLERTEAEYQGKISALETDKLTLEQNEKQLKSAINTHLKTEKGLRQQVDSMKTEISDICDKSKDLEDRLSALQVENSSLVEKCAKMTKDNDELNELVKSLKDDSGKRRTSSLHPVLPKIPPTLTPSAARKELLLKKPHPFAASKSLHAQKDREQTERELALESKQKELLEKISKLERETLNLKEGRSASGRVTSSLSFTPKSYEVSTSKDSPSSQDLLEKVHKLEKECSKEKNKVKDVEDQLSLFRAEVINLRDFVVTGKKRKMDTLHSRSKLGTSSSLNQIPEIASLESELKQKMAEIQHREETIRAEISPISVEKLKHQVIELEASEARLKKKVVELQLSEEDLKRKVRENERSVLTRPRSVYGPRCDGNHSDFLLKIDDLKRKEESLTRKIERLEQDAHNQDLSRKVDKLQQSERALKKQVERLETQQQSLTIATSSDMLDKPEDVLKQQINDLQKLEEHHREQISELEADREELHEIARRDKALIHDQNVRIRELQLSEKVFREQMERLESAEKSLYQKCEELESQTSKMEDQIHLLQIHERRLRELVKKLKLDEELWIAKSENMEMTVDELAASEANLKKRLDELATEKMTLAQKSEYLSLRCQELESSETTLFEKVKTFENSEVSLQNKLMVLENSEAAANSKISELDMMNMDISTRLQRAVEENAVLYNHIQGIQGNLQELNRQMLVVKDSEMGLKQEVESLEKSEVILQKKLKEFELRDIDNQAKVRQLEQTEAIMKDKISNLQRNENKLKYRIQELENTTKGKGSAKLPDEGGAVVKLPKSQFEEMQAKMVVLADTEHQMSEIKRLNGHLRQTIGQLRTGQGSCGHEVELDICRDRIISYENTMQRLSQILPQEQVPSLLNPDSDGSVQGSSEDLPARGLQSMESERVMQTMKGLTRSHGLAGPQPVTNTAEEQMPSDLSSVDEEPIMKNEESKSHTRPRVMNDAPSGAGVALEEHWRKIEAKKPRLETKTELAGNWKSVGKAVPFSTSRKGGEEELMIGVTLLSESEHSHYRSQNDSDSCKSSPQLHRAAVSSRTDSVESEAPPLPKTLPPSLTPNVASFEDRSYMAPSSDEDRFTSRKVLNPRVVPSSDRQMTSTVSVDSVADSGQGTLGTGSVMSTSRGSVIKNRIAQLERQLQSKSSGAESRSDEEDGSVQWKNKAPKRIDIIEKENKVAKEDINKLEKDLEEKRRCIDTFESWMTTAEAVLRNQAKLCDRDIVQNLQSQLVHLRSELQHAGVRRDDLTADPAALKSELDKRDREINNKTNEIKALNRELAHWQAECRRTEQMRSNALDSLRCLEVEISHLQYADEQLKQLQKEYNQLRAQLNDLQGVYQEYKLVVSEKQDLEDEVESLRNRLREVGIKEAEKSALEGELEGSSRLLNDRMERVEQLKQEVIRLQDKMTDIEHQNRELKTLQDDYYNIKSRYDEMEKLKNQALLSVAPLKAQVSRLGCKCREKDDFIRRLSEALRRSQSVDNLANLQDELDQFETDTENEEYYRPISPFIQSKLESGSRPAKINVNSFLRSSSGSRRSSTSSMSDKDVCSDSGSSSQRPRSADQLSGRPRSADQLSGRRSPFHGILQRSVNANNLSPRGTDGLVNSLKEKYGNLPDTCHFVAVTDYIPDILSTGGRPSLELRLQEGDKVKITGPMDENGYYEGESNGRVGLVPASCLQPVVQSSVQTPKERRLKKLKDPPSHVDSSPERVTEMYHQLQSSQLSPRQGQGRHSKSATSPTHKAPPRSPHTLASPKRSTSSTQTSSARKTQQTVGKSGPPDPPRQFHVERLVGETGIMLSWIPPALDELGNSNNSQVTGYRVYVNGRLCHQPSSPHLAKCVVEGVEQDEQQHFAIQTLASNGQTSGVVDTVYKPTDLPRWREESDGESDADFSSILSSRNYDQGQRRVFMGLYDYHPHYHSPHDYSSYELAFQAGDVISVFGQVRPDGFYHGEIDGNRGLVPASFIEEVPNSPRQCQNTSRSNMSLSSPQGLTSHRLPPRSPRS